MYSFRQHKIRLAQDAFLPLYTSNQSSHEAGVRVACVCVCGFFFSVQSTGYF